MTISYSNKSNAIRGFKQLFPAIAERHDNEAIRMDFINAEMDGTYSISLEAVADYQADRLGVVSGTTLVGVPCLRRSARVGAVRNAKHLFATMPAGTTRKAAIAAAVDAGIAFYTARTQYQAWSKAN